VGGRDGGCGGVVVVGGGVGGGGGGVCVVGRGSVCDREGGRWTLLCMA